MAAKARLKPGPDKAAKFLIIARARSGTTLLSSLLGQLPETDVDGEHFGRGRLRPLAYARDCARAAQARHYGYKLLSYQMAEVIALRDPERFLRAHIDDGYVLVHLVRDTLDQALSIARASESGTYHIGRGSGSGSRGAVDVDVTNFVNRLRWNVRLLDFERALMSRLPHVPVSYEDDLADGSVHQATADRLADAIGLPRGPVTAGLEKVLPNGLDEVAANAADLRAAIEDAGLSSVLSQTLHR